MKLIIAEPEEEEREVDLEPGTYLVGRSQDNQIAIKDLRASEKHARIVWALEDSACIIEDLKSKNGVYVNDVRVEKEKQLSGGDIISIGLTKIRLQDDAPHHGTMEIEASDKIGSKEERAGTMLMPQAHMIVLEKTKKTYKLGKTEVKALKGVDLIVGEGEFISICGPSGSGKSTLLNLIGCIDNPTSGSIFVMGKDVTKFSDSALSKMRNKIIGFIFQSFNLIPVLSAFENVEYPLVIQGMPKSKRYEKVIARLTEVGLSDFIKHKPEELSGGQRQRVAIARALVTTPRMVLADEPTANLDSKTSIEILELMKAMNENHRTTFIFSTHDPRIMKYAKKIYNIEDGVLKNEVR